MATTRIWAVKSRLDHMVDYVSNQQKTIDIKQVIDYATNESKTYEREYVSCINCSYLDPYQSMVNTKKQFNDEREILAFHGYQSFEIGEVNADIAHKIGVEYAQRMWGDKYEVVVATHLNTNHIHNHFLINATSFVDGKRYQNNYKELYEMRKINDEICKEYDLSIVDKQKNHGKSKSQYYVEKTYRDIVKEDVDNAVNCSFVFSQFTNELELMGYEIKITENNISVKHPCYDKFIRIKSFGRDYTNEAIKERVYELYKSKPLFSTIYDKKKFNIQPFIKKYEYRRLFGLPRLYINYQYKIGLIVKNNRKTVKHKEELKDAWKHINEITDQTILICKNNIESVEQLNKFKEDTALAIEVLTKYRQTLRNDMKKCMNEEMCLNYKQQIDYISKLLKIFRKDIRLCEGVEERCKYFELFEKEKERNINKRSKEYSR